MPCRTQNGKQICTRTNWWRDAMGIDWYSGGSQPPEIDYAALGETLLTTSEKSLAFYEFTNLTGINGAGISNGNAGLVNRRNPGVNDCVIVGSPIVRDITVNGDVVKTLHDEGVNGVSLGHNGESLFNRSKFSIFIVVETQDGQANSATWNLFGGITPVSAVNRGINVFVPGSAAALPGALSFQYGNADGLLRWETTTALFKNSINGICVIEVRADFDADTIKMFCNENEVASAHFSGTAIASIVPGDGKWNNTQPIYVTTTNNNGSAITNPNVSGFFAAAVVTELTEDERFNLHHLFYERYFKYRNEVHITSASDVTTLRALAENTIFNGAGLPNVTPTIQEGYTGPMHICDSSQLSNFESIIKYTFQFNDVDGFTWTNVAFLPKALNQNGKLLINCQGHISDDVAGHHALMNQALVYGYDVLFVAMPIGSNDNTETNPTVTQQSTTGHDQILTGGLDREGYNPLELYFFEKISMLNLIANDYSEIFATGISGGAWGLARWAAIDTRIKRIAPTRGCTLRSFRDQAVAIEGDFEQAGGMFISARCGPRQYAFYSQISALDYFAMAASGGRKVKYLNHITDPTAAFAGITPVHWAKEARIAAIKAGGTYEHFLLTDSGQSSHAYNADDITEIFKHFGHV